VAFVFRGYSAEKVENVKLFWPDQWTMDERQSAIDGSGRTRTQLVYFAKEKVVDGDTQIVIDAAGQNKLPAASAGRFFLNNITYICSLLMAIAIQPCVLPMYEELQLKIRTPKTFMKATIYSTVFIILLFVVVNLAACYAFSNALMVDDATLVKALMGGQTASNWTSYFYVIIPIGFIFVSISMYPFMLLPMTAPLKKKLGKNMFIGVNVAVV